MERIKDEDENPHVEKDVFDVKKIYWDNDGNLRHGTTERNRDEEIIKLLQADSNNDSDWTKLWMIVPSRWVRFWLLFAYYKVGDPPGPIDMLSLIKQDRNAPGGWRAKKSLLAPSNKFGEERPGHYRRISLEAWVHLVDLYGVDGYALAVRGTPYEDTTRWRVFKDPKRIDINLLPEPIEPVVEVVEEKSLAKDLLKGVSGGLGKLFGGGDKDKDKDNKDKKSDGKTDTSDKAKAPATSTSSKK